MLSHQAPSSPVPRTELQRARLSRGLSRERLAARAGISIATVYRAEAGLAAPTHGSRRLIAQALGVPLERIFPEQSEAPGSTGASRRVAGGGDHDEQ